MLSAPTRTRAHIAADAAQTRRRNTAARHQSLVSRVHHLFNVKRQRLDDTYKQVAEEFGLAQTTVERLHANHVKAATRALGQPTKGQPTAD